MSSQNGTHDGYHIWKYNKPGRALFMLTTRGRHGTASGERAFWQTREAARKWAEAYVDRAFEIKRCRCRPGVGMVDHG